jgi:putative transport protein
MEFLLSFLADNPIVFLFVVIGFGFMLGNIKIFGFNLGVSAVLFSGIAFGALDKRLTIPEYIYILGLVLFIYAIGLQSGPSFFASFNRKGVRLNIFAVALLLFATVIIAVFSLVFGMDISTAAGIFCGALTNTPALAASVETVNTLSRSMPPGVREHLASNPVIAYGLTYPFGVFGMLLWFYIGSKALKIDFAEEERIRLKKTGSNTILNRTFRVTNPNVIGKSVEEVMHLYPLSGFVLSRIKQDDDVYVSSPEIVLNPGDLIAVAGTEDSLTRAEELFGDRADKSLLKESDEIDYRRIFVSNHDVIGKPIHTLHLEKRFGATVTRVRRGDIDFVPDPSTTLELGDRIRVVSRHEKINTLTKYFGDSVKALAETDFLSISGGIVAGVLLGMIPVPLPNGTVFKLGYAGGPLIVALILGRLERTGSITWTLPFNANLVLRQIGMVLFLAVIGTNAGYAFGETLKSGGLMLIAAGAVLTTAVTVGGMLVGYKYMNLSMATVLGIVSAVGTQPACLQYANQQSQNEQANVSYATVYPASMIVKIILAQVIVSAFWR